jgi:hypothetical protein
MLQVVVGRRRVTYRGEAPPEPELFKFEWRRGLLTRRGPGAARRRQRWSRGPQELRTRQ